MTNTTKNLQKEIKKTATDALDSAKSTAESVQRDLADAAGDAREAVQNVFLAGLGALAVTGEEGSKMFKTLVSKGEGVSLPGIGGERIMEARKQLSQQADKAQDAVEDAKNGAVDTVVETVTSAEDRVQEAVASVMKRLGVPTRNEIASLTASVERLTARVERLKEEAAPVLEADAAAVDSALEAPVLEAVGGGWYEVRVSGIVVDKVQGREAAEASLARVQAQRA
ncbi:phasin family protein [Rubrivirga sp.]|uniref:phasin family protein n=1 Tax=Rubrivirga sp. TaxID=1885344 RepID=UPI003C78CBF0